MGGTMNSRDKQIDVLRGIALFCMIAANMVPYLLITPHPFIERFIGSLAAPLFVTLAGMMASLSRYKPAHGFKYFLTRGSLLILIGAALDVSTYQFFPFTSMDVLYLIGVSLILSYPLIFVRLSWRIALVLLVFILTPFLQKTWGYHAIPVVTTLTLSWQNMANFIQAALQTWLIEGYFPIFPWFGYFILGTVLGSLRWDNATTRYFNHHRFLVFTLLLLIGGASWWFTHPGIIHTRFGYSELFYPPSLGFMATSVGMIFILLYLVDTFPSLRFYWPLALYGKSSMFIYLIHGMLIVYVLGVLFQPEPVLVYLELYGGLCTAILLMAWILDKMRYRLKKAPFLIRFILGA